MDMVVMDMVDMDMVDIFMSRTFLAQFGLVSSFIYIRTSYNIGQIAYDYDYTSCLGKQTWPSGHMNVKLNPTGGAGCKSGKDVYFFYFYLSTYSNKIKIFRKEVLQCQCYKATCINHV